MRLSPHSIDLPPRLRGPDRFPRFRCAEDAWRRGSLDDALTLLGALPDPELALRRSFVGALAKAVRNLMPSPGRSRHGFAEPAHALLDGEVGGVLTVVEGWVLGEAITPATLAAAAELGERLRQSPPAGLSTVDEQHLRPLRMVEAASAVARLATAPASAVARLVEGLVRDLAFALREREETARRRVLEALRDRVEPDLDAFRELPDDEFRAA